MCLDTPAIIDTQRAIDDRKPLEKHRRPAKVFIIVKTLNHTLAIKGFYYAMKGCRPVMKGCTPAMYLDTSAIIDVRRVIDDRRRVIDGRRPDEKHRRRAMSLNTPVEAFDTWW